MSARICEHVYVLLMCCRVADSTKQEFLLRLTFPNSVVENYGAPVEAWLNVSVPSLESRTISMELTVVNKTATRVPGK